MSSPQYAIRGARSDEDLRQILALQAANLRGRLEPEERRAQGFVTLRHNMALLREMCGPWEHVVAAVGEQIVAYALVLLFQVRGELTELDPLFERLGRLRYRGRPVLQWRFYIMGQICIAREHRGRGLVERLYAEHRARMAPHFDLMVTDIDRENPRSLRAHQQAGFEILDEYRDAEGKEWLVVALDLQRGGDRTPPPGSLTEG